MSIEIKTIDVANSEESTTIEKYLLFGWTLKSSQRVYNKDSHLEQRGNDVYSVTQTTDFTKLIFERDTNIPHYRRLCELEKDFEQVSLQALAKSEELKTVCPSKSTIAEFAQKKKSQIYLVKSAGKKYRLIALGIGVIAFLGVAFEASRMDNRSLIDQLKYEITQHFFDGFLFGLIPCLVFGGIIALVAWLLHEKIALHAAIKNPHSRYRPTLEKKYQENRQKALDLEEALDTLGKQGASIMNEARSLLS